MSKQRNIRKRRAVDDEEDEITTGHEDEQPLTAEEIRLLQKQRQRKTGVEAATLAGAGTKKHIPEPSVPLAEEDVLHAAFKQERKRLSDADDPEMKRYVEQQLAIRLGKELPDEAGKGSKRPKTVDEMALEAAVPKQKELYSDPGAAFVAGVTEVPLGVEHKLKNIEATEAAKAALLKKGGNAARAMRGGGFQDFEDDDGYGGASGGGCRRGQFPVRFGKMKEKEQAVLAEVAAKKAVQRSRALEKKEKKNQEFKGFF